MFGHWGPVFKRTVREIKMSEAMIIIGAIAGAFGVKGEVRLKSFTSDPETIADYSPLLTEDGSRSYEVRLTGQLKNGFSAKLSGVHTKEQADGLRGLQLFVPRSKFPNLPNDEFYYADLLGLSVFSVGGAELGHIKMIQNHGATDLLEIFTGETGKSVLLPFTQINVPTVDISSGKIIIDPPEGLFEDNLK